LEQIICILSAFWFSTLLAPSGVSAYVDYFESLELFFVIVADETWHFVILSNQL